MVQCINCQSSLENNVAICEFCGFNLSSQEFEPSSNQSDIRCYICNNKAGGSCSKCGKEVCMVHLTAMNSTQTNSNIIRTSNFCSLCAKKVRERIKYYAVLFFAIFGIFVLLMFLI